MMYINLTSLFNDFNHTRFFVIVCLAVFTFLLSLRLDNYISGSYWVVFAPLWLWKLTALLGMFTGVIAWLAMPKRHKFEGELFVQFKAMLFTFLANMLLLTFEMAACEKLEANRSDTLWSVCFIPLLGLSLLSFATFLWSLRNERSFDMDLIFSINLLQFIFIALRLDSIVRWHWAIVLIPLWIEMTVMLLAWLYTLIVNIVIVKNNAARRRSLAISHSHSHIINTSGNARAHIANTSNHSSSSQMVIMGQSTLGDTSRAGTGGSGGGGAGYYYNAKWTKLLISAVLLMSLLAYELLLVHKLDRESEYRDREFAELAPPQPPPLMPLMPWQDVARSSDTQGAKAANVPISVFAGIKNGNGNWAMKPHQYHQQQYQQQNEYNDDGSATSELSSSSSSFWTSYSLIAVPLYVAFVCASLLSFGSHTGNVWWFGARVDFCDLFLLVCTPCQTYGNVQLKVSMSGESDEKPASSASSLSPPHAVVLARHDDTGDTHISVSNMTSTHNTLDASSSSFASALQRPSASTPQTATAAAADSSHPSSTASATNRHQQACARDDQLDAAPLLVAGAPNAAATATTTQISRVNTSSRNSLLLFMPD